MLRSSTLKNTDPKTNEHNSHVHTITMASDVTGSGNPDPDRSCSESQCDLKAHPELKSGINKFKFKKVFWGKISSVSWPKSYIGHCTPFDAILSFGKYRFKKYIYTYFFTLWLIPTGPLGISSQKSRPWTQHLIPWHH